MAKESAGHHRYKITISIIAASIFLLATCMNADDNDAAKEDTTTNNKIKEAVSTSEFEQYAGSVSCTKCHQDIANHFINTAHHLTSAPANKNNIKGSFKEDDNTFFFNPRLAVAMEKRKDKFYQVLYYDGEEQKAEPFDIAIGSGNMGQSFLYWKNNNLYQLPITYFSAAKEWSNSPGFLNNADFSRDITSRCLECHTTFVKTIPAENRQPEAYDRHQIIYGIECEKCHGPAAKHVAFQSQHPQDTIGKFIVNPANFSRQQSLDLCALCHGGRLAKIKPSFSFEAGDTLTNFFTFDPSVPDPNSVDVHGNQYGLLRSSKCFIKSNTMTCNTCHNTHNNEKGQPALFSARCMTCHSTAHHNFCKLAGSLGDIIKTNCIDCHMPLNPSRAIAVFLPGKSEPTAALIRSHYIAIYPEETKKVMSHLKNMSK